jgi:hypothetical protein
MKLSKFIGALICVIGCLILFTLILFSKNVAATNPEKTCNNDNNGNQHKWQCNLGHSDSAIQVEAYNIEYRSTLTSQYHWVSDSEYSGWIALDKENMKAMTEYSNSDPGGGVNVNPGSWTWVYSDPNCDKWTFYWTGTFDGKSFKWWQIITVCGDSTPSFYWSDNVQFDNNPGYTVYEVVAHKSQLHVLDSIHMSSLYWNLLQIGQWDSVGYEKAVGAVVGPGGATAQVWGNYNYQQGLLDIYDFKGGGYLDLKVLNFNLHPGYSDSTWYFADDQQQVGLNLIDIWLIAGGSFQATSRSADFTYELYNWIN